MQGSYNGEGYLRGFVAATCSFPNPNHDTSLFFHIYMSGAMPQQNKAIFKSIPNPTSVFRKNYKFILNPFIFVSNLNFV